MVMAALQFESIHDVFVPWSKASPRESVPVFEERQKIGQISTDTRCIEIGETTIES
jgi:hypothetical protein